jgi:hypothetical protein
MPLDANGAAPPFSAATGDTLPRPRARGVIEQGSITL